ncbi:hypothetical protein MKX54_01805 [Alkalihalobacillus sp. FSL R5-0424]
MSKNDVRPDTLHVRSEAEMDKAFEEMERLSNYDFTTKSRDQIIKDLKLDARHSKNLEEGIKILTHNGVKDGFSLIECLEEIENTDEAQPKGLPDED